MMYLSCDLAWQWGGNNGGQPAAAAAAATAAAAGGGLWNSTTQPVVPAPSPGQSQSVWNNDHSSIWNHSDNSSSAGGFWDNPEPSKPNKPASARTPTKPNNQQNHSRGGGGGAAQAAAVQHTNATTKVSKKKGKDENDMVKKLFTENVSQADNFTQWCKSSLNTMKVHASIDSKLRSLYDELCLVVANNQGMKYFCSVHDSALPLMHDVLLNARLSKIAVLVKARIIMSYPVPANVGVSFQLLL
ncbi:hypothetical protein GWK47_029138 [Chionoecetes opilio]|uniref:Uncharacterized protein n=1 Tax=Chionoecetes opilio TaxID=41210 RepID=A0A8J5D375_CHIOP|nr:hypothetical protein GWK47_029138 [Chionoecetes opilio]